MTPKIKALKSVGQVLLTSVLWLTIMDMLVVLFCLFFEIQSSNAFVQFTGAFNGVFIGLFYMGPAFVKVAATYEADKAAAASSKQDDGGPDNAA